MWLAGQGSNLEPPDPKLALELLNKGHEFASAQLRVGIVFSSGREHSWLF